MSTNPIPPVPVGPGDSQNPDNPDPDMPDLVDPTVEEETTVGTRPDDDSPLSQPASNPDQPEENPDDQLPRFDS
ncbi:hypothetical protein ACGFIF_34085 [Kribbella sp. NPDC049174]|jgi:hypothetical protein|uniref:hypothetical protein n=1 Tax=Kribbella sp. NPDC049174 TaxID=3364112 RepID=UPI00372385E9